MGKSQVILCDTNIFLALFHGDTDIRDELNEIGYYRLALSAVTVGEIYHGMSSNKNDRDKTKKYLSRFDTFHLDTNVSKRMIALMHQHRDRHPSIADCLIAATVLCNQLELFTFNVKHFNYYSSIKLYKPIRCFEEMQNH